MRKLITYCPSCRAQRDALYLATNSESETLSCTVCGVDLSIAATNVYREDSRVLFEAWLDGGIPELAKHDPAVVRLVSWFDSEVRQRFAKPSDELTNAERYRFVDQYFGAIVSGGAQL